MLVLDTNVVSEPMKEPLPRGAGVLDRHRHHPIQGKGRRGLLSTATRTFGVFFAKRVLPFDHKAAQAYAVIVVQRRTAEHPISQADCQIAAIAYSRRASIAARDAAGFHECGLDGVHP